MRTTHGGPRAWLREHPLVPDAVLAVLLTAAAIPLAFVAGAPPSPEWPDPRPPSALSLTLIAVACLALAFRRRRPFAMLCLAEAAHTVLTALHHNASLAGVALLVLIYTVASAKGLALSLTALALDLVAFLLVLAVSGGGLNLTGEVFGVVLTMTAWVVGRSVRLRRAYLSELRDRAARLERAREADTRAARAEERSRIARELHDVVAHHVSVMTVQAAAARRILTSNPEGAEEALSAIEQMGRTAMAEMRSIVGVLRTDGQDGPAERGPQPGVRELPALVEQMREAGLNTQLWVEGERVPLPPGIDLAAYRLVQEALTNTLRHAGPAARAWVTVRHEPGEFSVHIEDDGTGMKAGAPAVTSPDGGRRTGHGLVGIRERVALYGGILRIGPRPGGGFEVRARFPLKDDA
ncbi:signal transduction histidine kinase [Thermocatellispora tengchongensis]|uniref:histidine kinase n=1 Tax=Thermocatellispora tengchongensis TaxID=1073253 RepID=A0A840P971_9ACTN|nr:sensor histidine kinase [Thermocatellispora tengchongensis]MBB5135842.1 signal transduction histidine kinase [Thermocatellispora tengchongensis]